MALSGYGKSYMTQHWSLFHYHVQSLQHNIIQVVLTSSFKQGTANDVFMFKDLENWLFKLLGIICCVIYIQEFHTKRESFYSFEGAKVLQLLFSSFTYLLQ